MQRPRDKHIYTLPDGKEFDNMKDAREYLGIGGESFKNLVRKGIVKKTVITTKAQSYEQQETAKDK